MLQRWVGGRAGETSCLAGTGSCPVVRQQTAPSCYQTQMLMVLGAGGSRSCYRPWASGPQPDPSVAGVSFQAPRSAPQGSAHSPPTPELCPPRPLEKSAVPLPPLCILEMLPVAICPLCALAGECSLQSWEPRLSNLLVIDREALAQRLATCRGHSTFQWELGF